ncbi:hypothetical protein AABD41_14990 [Staphylococcus pseudoxylosus]|uniref:hypothetical protein n=1 Tax=Staphylococcus pseudoxylosus TaxID=2282419 RepID=UPI00398A571B
MAYEHYEKLLKDAQKCYRSGLINNANLLNKLQEVYRKAKAYDLLKEDLLINEKVFREQAEYDEVSNIIHGHYVALLEQSKLERADDVI